MLAAVKNSLRRRTTIHENRNSVGIPVDVEVTGDDELEYAIKELIEDLSANRSREAQALSEVAG